MSDAALEIAGLTLATEPPTADELQQRHRRERKEHQANVQALKKSADKGDKKRKREVLQQIADLDAALEQRHDAELQQFASTATTTSTSEHSAGDVADHHADPPATGFLASSSASDDGGSQRVSKAQKRRDKKAAADRQLQADILAQEELNKTGARTVETTALRTLLRARHLQLHAVPSDGDCLYNAIDHQLVATGRRPHGTAALRTLTADYIEANRDELIVYMTNPRTGDCLGEAEFRVYCEAVRSSATWGGQLEIKALSNALAVPIEVLQASGPPTVQNEGDFGGEPLVLTYHRHMYSLGEHYNGTQRLAADDGGDGSCDEDPSAK